ncbi:DNA primase family protein [Blastococcus saxobsidens]|uniref:Putative DNA primase/helicase n=1 Tax=Blastococcus saxobsidens TaxID=138336 RepID=A0A4Q7Y435_9ACTN|nr:phage/plasmid primase, P4 family [Blastococcus saxobsidens]RZU30625.1 putative DNA primase/helicase [Blastococcus saxobsidens]
MTAKKFSHDGKGAPEKGSALARVQARLRELGATPKEGSETDWHCPLKENHRNGDQNASLTARYGDETPNKVIVACAQCRTKANGPEFLKALGLTAADLVDGPSPKPGRGKVLRDKTKIHAYVDEQGEALFRVVKRYYENAERPDVVQQRPNGRGGWAKTAKERPEKDGKALMHGVRRPLYRLPEVVDAVKNGWELHLTEGESDADALNDWFTAHDAEARATCHPGGAGKWQPEHTDTLAGAAAVVVWADRDGPGYACAHQRLSAVLAADLTAEARLPVEGKDVRDHLAAGHAPHDGKPVKKKKLAKLAGDAGQQQGSASGSSYPVRSWDDYGMAERVVDRYARILRRINDAEKWAVYDGGVWRLRAEGDDRTRGLVRKVVENLPEQEAHLYSDEDREGFVKWVKGRRKSGAESATVQALRSKRTLFASVNDFDRPGDQHLNCRNGVLNLETLQLGEHSPAHYFTRMTKADFLVGARDKDWDEFLDLALPDEEVRAYAQRIFGMSLLDGNPAKLLVVLLGPNDALKSAFLKLLLEALGDYGMAFNLSMLRAKQEAGPRGDLAERLPCRLIGAFEASQQWKLHADQIKMITGQDPVAARYSYDRVDTVRVPGYLPVIVTNAMPTIEGADKAFLRRLVVLPFLNSLPPEKQNSTKAARMLASPTVLAAALAWMVDGLRQYQAAGLGSVPLAVQSATEQSRRALSPFDAFLHDCCETGDGLEEPRVAFWVAYQTWCELNDVAPSERLNKNAFGMRIDDRYPARRKVVREDGEKKFVWMREGIRLNPTMQGMRG